MLFVTGGYIYLLVGFAEDYMRVSYVIICKTLGLKENSFFFTTLNEMYLATDC